MYVTTSRTAISAPINFMAFLDMTSNDSPVMPQLTKQNNSCSRLHKHAHDEKKDVHEQEEQERIIRYRKENVSQTQGYHVGRYNPGEDVGCGYDEQYCSCRYAAIEQDAGQVAPLYFTEDEFADKKGID